MSVHPSGKLALVNLVRGRRSFYYKLGKEASLVHFDESGEKFSMVIDDKVNIHDSEDVKLIVELDNTKKVLCVSSLSLGF